MRIYFSDAHAVHAPAAFVSRGQVTANPETPARVSEITQRIGIQTIKAIGVSREEDIAVAADYEPICNWLMFDAKTPADADRPGGMGLSFDWNILSGRRWRKPWPPRRGSDSQPGHRRSSRCQS